MKEITAQMAGIILALRVNVGDVVAPGQEIAVLESMKMEIPLTSEYGGTVVEISAQIGDFINEGDCILKLE
ncbi:biotin/lipoyl-containing protein [Carboxydocella sp. ULO1]|uniref:biotin/lipoyl-containing protein n=1 Tax=Carboxydocella sp. ULO1 TaxID=1926599 RepID=UPI0009AE9C1F|nr:biotin/lipoyl-containing protein [Carboxydocella sp. ULO1]GAW27947.1 acetyl-CoA carboxylase biotin carboxyl carrier protein subunit [Carboxydocella sp. ULO1]